MSISASTRRSSTRDATDSWNVAHDLSAQDRAYKYVKTQILSLSLKPGAWIKAQHVAMQVEVSRTPVREALSRLEQEGFVRRNQGWGYVVESVTFQQAFELYKVREVLEAEAVREAATKATTQQLEELDALLDKAGAACARESIANFRTHTRAFHVAIAKAAANCLLMRMLSQLQDHVRLVGAMVFEKHAERMREVLDENWAILAALRRRDPDDAETAARYHVRRAWTTYMRYVVARGSDHDEAFRVADRAADVAEVASPKEAIRRAQMHSTQRRNINSGSRGDTTARKGEPKGN